MKSLGSSKLFLVAVFLGCLSLSVASTVPPTCGLLCIEDLTPKSSCPLTNITCICNNQDLVDAIALCVSANCTIREALTTEKFSKEICGAPIVDRTKIVSIAGVVGGSIAFIAFLLRIWVRFKGIGGKMGLDDLCLCFTMLLNIPYTVFSVVLANRGLGRDIWEVSFDDITYILYIFFWDELIYLSALPLIKISILLFYLRIFPEKRFRIIVWVLIACNVGYAISFVLISVFQCRPLSGAWTRWDGTFTGTCNNINLQGWMSAAFNIVLDFVTLCLPLPSLYKLNLSRKKKILVFLMFGVGFFVTIVSVLRLQSLLQFANTTNITQDYVSIGYWSTIEIHVGIICACMPAIRQLFQSTFPAAFGSTFGNSVGTPVDFSGQTRRPSVPHISHKSWKKDDNSSVHELIGMAS